MRFYFLLFTMFYLDLVATVFFLVVAVFFLAVVFVAALVLAAAAARLVELFEALASSATISRQASSVSDCGSSFLGIL